MTDDTAKVVPIHRFPSGTFDERRSAYEQSRHDWAVSIGLPARRWRNPKDWSSDDSGTGPA